MEQREHVLDVAGRPASGSSARARWAARSTTSPAKMAGAIHAPGCGVASAARGGSAPTRTAGFRGSSARTRSRSRPLSHVTQRPQLTPAARPHGASATRANVASRTTPRRGSPRDSAGAAGAPEPRRRSWNVNPSLKRKFVRMLVSIASAEATTSCIPSTPANRKRREVHDHPGRPNQGEPCRASLHRGFPSGVHAVSRAPEGHSRNGACPQRGLHAGICAESDECGVLRLVRSS